MRFLFTLLVPFIAAASPQITSERIAHYLEVYKDFHRNPELGLQEKATAGKVASHLRALGIQVIENIGGYGLVGIIENGVGPIGMLRADMDALPLKEKTGVEYASQVAGVMHACGHDAHMTLALAVAEVFQRSRDQWSGTLYFVFQPAEEIGKGAKAMLDDGLFRRLKKPDYALALHAHAGLTPAETYLRAGETLASVDSVDVTFNGTGGHGAMPHLTIDPIPLGASFVSEIQRLIAREVNPLNEALITVGSFHAGTVHNIIPQTAKLQLTVRAYDDGVRSTLLQRITDLASGLSAAHRANPPEVVHLMGIPSVYNDPVIHQRVQNAVSKVTEVKVLTAPKTMAGDDFSYFFKQEGIPSLFFWIGAQNPATPKPWPGAHTATYAPDFPAFLKSGLKVMHATLTELQKNN